MILTATILTTRDGTVPATIRSPRRSGTLLGELVFDMESLRLAPTESIAPVTPCCRCDDGSRAWDRIARHTYCPNCLERLAHGETPPIVEPIARHRCAVCHHLGSVRYVTYPLHSRRPIEIDLCSEHLRNLISRRLGPHAFEQLRRQLTALGIGTNDVFLLHDAFYDPHGRARQPVEDGFC